MLRLTAKLSLVALLFLHGCSDSSTGQGEVGAICSPTQQCADGLECADGICSPNSGPAFQATDGVDSPTPSDTWAANDGGTGDELTDASVS
jgi:hypothetical protein